MPGNEGVSISSAEVLFPWCHLSRPLVNFRCRQWRQSYITRRSCEVATQRDLYLELPNVSEIWQAFSATLLPKNQVKCDYVNQSWFVRQFMRSYDIETTPINAFHLLGDTLFTPNPLSRALFINKDFNVKQVLLKGRWWKRSLWHLFRQSDIRPTSALFSPTYQLFLRFLRGLVQGPVNSPNKGQWRGNVSIWWRHHVMPSAACTLTG